MASTSEMTLRAAEQAREDAALIGRCRKGEQAAWDDLIARYQRLVFSIPKRAGLSDDEASDIFQDTFFTLFQKLDDLEQPDRVRSWLVTTAKFKTWAVVRSGRSVQTYATDEEMEQELAALPSTDPLADTSMIEAEEQHMVRTAIATLDERCRTILGMLYVAAEAASYAEVAAEIGVGETSISPLRTRCLEKLRKAIFGK